MSRAAKSQVFLCLYIIHMSVRCFAATHKIFNCSSDFCNRYDADQFCSTREQKCRDCSTIRDDCHSLALPVACTSWCIKYNADQAVQKAKAKNCTFLEDIANGHHNASSADYVNPGDVVAVSCNAGFKIKGDFLLKCRDYGQWSNDVPKCEAVMCSMPPPFENGVWIPNSPNDVSFGTQLTVKCNNGYRAKDTYTWTCSQTGIWNLLGNRHMPLCLEAKHDFGVIIWKALAIVSLVLLTLLGGYILKRRLCIRHRRKKTRKMSEQQKQIMKCGVPKEEVNDSKTTGTSAELEQLLMKENELPDAVSIQKYKRRSTKAVVTNIDGAEPNPLPNLTSPNNPIEFINIEEAARNSGQTVHLQVNINSMNGKNNTVNNENNAVAYSGVNNSRENVNGNESDEKESMVIGKADKMPVEEAATSATAQPEQNNESKIKMDVAGQTVVRSTDFEESSSRL